MNSFVVDIMAQAPPWMSPRTLLRKVVEEERKTLLPCLDEGKAYQSALPLSSSSLPPSFPREGPVDDNQSAAAVGSSEREEDRDSAAYSEGLSSRDDFDGFDDAKEEEEEEEEDEGPPSLTEAFQSIENRPILKLCAGYLTIYLGVAVLAFSYIFESWTIIDSLYFAVSTFTTCGYGDLEPTTTAGQIFTILFAIYGVIILGVFIGIVGSFISEHQQNATLTAEEEYGDQVLETLFAGIEDRAAEMEKAQLQHNITSTNGNKPAPSPPKPKQRSYTYKEAREDFLGDQITMADDVMFVLRSEAKPILLVAVGALILGLREHWSITSILYFCVMAASTTGYGDYTPQTQMDKVYCLFFYPLAVCVFGEVLARIAGVYMQRKQRGAEHKFLHRALTLCDLRKMDTNRDGSVTKEEFISYMLVALQKVDQEFIDDLREIFDNIDTTGKGILEKRDLVKLTKKNYRPLQKIREELSQMEEWPFPPFVQDSLHSTSVTPDPPAARHRRFNTIA